MRSFALRLLTLVPLVLVLLAPVAGSAAEPPAKVPAAAPSGPVSFYKQVRPILQMSCYGCHQPAQHKGGLDMTSLKGMLDGGDSEEAAIVPGKADLGSLLRMVTSEKGKPPEMPKEGAALSKDQIALVRRWIVAGAKDDSPPADVAEFTAEHPPRYAALPVIPSIAISPDGKLLAVAGYHEVLLHRLDPPAAPVAPPPAEAKPSAAAAAKPMPPAAAKAAPKKEARPAKPKSAPKKIPPPPLIAVKPASPPLPPPAAKPALPLAPLTPPRLTLAGRLVGLSERIQSVVFSPDGKLLAAVGGSPARMGEVQIWDVEKQKLIRSINVTHDTLYGAAFSPDGKLLAFGCGDNTLRAIDVKSGKQVFYQMTHTDWVMDCVFSVNGTDLVSVSRDFSVKLNEVATQRFVDNITSITPGALKGGLNAIARHPKRDELLIGGSDGTPKIYRMFRQKERVIGDDFNLIRGFASLPGRIYSVCYSPDGTQVAAGSSDEGGGAVWLFNEADAKLLAKMQGIDSGIYSVVFTPDARWLISAGFSGHVFLNEAATGKLRLRYVPVPVEKSAAKSGSGTAKK